MPRSPRQQRQLATIHAILKKAQNTPDAGNTLFGGGEMLPGDWELRAWMENERAPEMKISEQVFSERLDAIGAMFPVRRIIFREFYKGARPEHIECEEGVISGYLVQGAVAPFPEHRQNVRGSYSKDRFSVEIDLSIVQGVKQVIKGQLIKPLT